MADSADERMTVERLRTWVQSQAEREHLCLHLWPLLGDYRFPKPRNPYGGPDGGRDLEASYKGEQLAFGAVGWKANATDDYKQVAEIKSKFKADLASALATQPDLKVFAFFTNLELKRSDRRVLEQYATKKGIEVVEIFYRDRLRQALDSAAGLLYRLKYLGLPVTPGERDAFDAYFSERIDAGLRYTATQLDRIEFLHALDTPVRWLDFVIRLDAPYSAGEMDGPYAAALVIGSRERGAEAPFVGLGNVSFYLGDFTRFQPTTAEGAKATLVFCQRQIAWSFPPLHEYEMPPFSDEQDHARFIRTDCRVDEPFPFPRLRDFDHLDYTLYATANLAQRIEDVSLFVNEYAILSLSSGMLEASPVDNAALSTLHPGWPEQLSGDGTLTELRLRSGAPSHYRSHETPYMPVIHSDFSMYVPAKSTYRPFSPAPFTRGL
jgi:hypothetical protein